MSTIVATNPVGLFNAQGEAISRDAALFVAGTSLLALPWRADRLSTSVTGSAAATVQCPEDWTSSSIDNLVVTASHTALMFSVAPYSTYPGSGSYASTPAANGVTVDFDFFGTALGFVQVQNSISLGYYSDEISCRIDGVAYPLDEILPVMPGYNTTDTSAQVRHLIAATDLPREWHHCTLAVLSDPSVQTQIWLSEILLEPNEINQALPAASVFPRATMIGLTASYQSLTARSGNPLTQGVAISRLWLANTTGSAVQVSWRPHLAYGQAQTQPFVVTVAANSTVNIDPPSGRAWMQTLEALASVTSGVFASVEIAR